MDVSPPTSTNPPTDPTDAEAVKAMSPREFRKWNKLADGMATFHDRFEREFNYVYQMADGGWRAKVPFPRFIREAEQVSHHLDMHHRIEEAYFFPMLAKKLPQFSTSRGGAEHVASHRAIHRGLDKYDAVLERARRDPDGYDGKELREVMDGFREVLFNHLEEEVRDLGAESVYAAGFTLDELARFPM
ncbi:hypothetical protein CspHIS471_0211140 [Cutaneotrichosporon sp. HIS471]|nr:hypothetical protein CspHIS471_0211140 [Cutaneotrichosporon sp. HIS471]